MTTTPEEPRPDEGRAPGADEAAPQATPDEAAPAPAAGETASAAGGTADAQDTAPLTLHDTAPLAAGGTVPPNAQDTPPAPPTAPAAPPAAATPPAAAYPAYPGYQSPYAGQPYAGPAAQPYAGYPAHPGQQPAYPPQYGYGSRPVGAGQPYASYPPAQQPYGAQHPYAAPGAAGPVPVLGAPEGPGAPGAPGVPGPDGTVPAPGPRRRSTWIPVVVALVVVVLLGTAAILIASHRWNAGSDAAGSGAQPTSIANIGQGSSGEVPVSGSTAENPDWAAVAAAVQGAVVAIDVQTDSGEALGSGVVVDAQGHVVTNNHVVEGLSGDTAQVTLSDGRIYDAKVAGTDASTDLAVLTIQDPPSDLTVAQFGSSDDVKVGDPVMAVGNPLGLANTVTTGIVSAVDRPVSPQSETGGSTTQGAVTNAIQIDAAINPGNSGGPLFDVKGQVIGITSSIATTSSTSGSIGLGFAIPVNLVQNIAQQLIADGSAEHAYLGVTLQGATATADGVTRAGAKVMSVQSGSPAEKAGLQVGDVVVAIDDKPVGSQDSLAAYVRSMAAGDKASLVLVRDGKSLTLDVTLAAQPDSQSQSSQGSGSSNGNQNQNGSSGSSNGLPENLQNMTPEQLWEWLQQHQDQGQSGQSGQSQGNGNG